MFATFVPSQNVHPAFGHHCLASITQSSRLTLLPNQGTMDNPESDTSTVGSNVRFPEPLAIVGTGLRLPGEVRTTEDLWALLVAKVSARSRVPEDRFNVDAFYSNSGRPGAMRTAFGHFLTEPNCLKHLDTHMFPMLKKELDVLDPQERLLLEVVYECMQNAGQTDWRGQDIGCFVGVFGEVSARV